MNNEIVSQFQLFFPLMLSILVVLLVLLFFEISFCFYASTKFSSFFFFLSFFILAERLAFLPSHASALALAIVVAIAVLSIAMIPCFVWFGIITVYTTVRNNYAIWTSPCYILLLTRLVRFEARIRSKKPPQDLHQIQKPIFFVLSQEKRKKEKLSKQHTQIERERKGESALFSFFLKRRKWTGKSFCNSS